MKKIRNAAAILLIALTGFAAIGAGVLIAATAIVIGAVIALAARLAVASRAEQDGVTVDIGPQTRPEPA